MVLNDAVIVLWFRCMVFLNISQTVVFANSKYSSAISDIYIITNPDQPTKDIIIEKCLLQ